MYTFSLLCFTIIFTVIYSKCQIKNWHRFTRTRHVYSKTATCYIPTLANISLEDRVKLQIYAIPLQTRDVTPVARQRIVGSVLMRLPFCKNVFEMDLSVRDSRVSNSVLNCNHKFQFTWTYIIVHKLISLKLI